MVELPHFNDQGHARMVDVGAKPVTKRTAIASAVVTMKSATMDRILNRKIAKGDVLELARVAGVMASKRAADVIPLCHPLRLDSVNIEIEQVGDNQLKILAQVSAMDRTGVEMEALTSASVAGLTIYDMCKSIDRSMTIGPIQLEFKSGGKSGTFQRQSI